MRDHESPTRDTTLPRYSETDPMDQNGTESPEEQASERQHLLSEERRAFDSDTFNILSSHTSGHVGVLPEVECATSKKEGDRLDDESDQLWGIPLSSQSSFPRSIP